MSRPPGDLASGGIVLRRHQPGDAAAMHEAALESVAEVAPYETWCHEDYTAAEAAEYVNGWVEGWEARTAFYYTVTDGDTGGYLGACGLCPIDWDHRTAGLGFWVRTSWTGRGVATTAARLVARSALDDLAMNRVQLLIAVDNTASRRVAEKLGAAYEGTLRKRLVLPAGPTDMAMYALVR